MSLLGLDVARTHCRALAIALDGGVVAHARRDYALSGGPGGQQQFDAHAAWAAVCDALSEIASATQKDPIRALSIAACEALVPLSSEGRILGYSLPKAGVRSAGYTARIVEDLGAERYYDIVGQVPDAQSLLSQLCWLKECDQPLYERTWRFAPPNSLITHLLGGGTFCDLSLAASTHLLDLGRMDWSPRVLASCGLSPLKLPELRPAGTAVGTLSPAIARELGLPQGISLVLGGHALCCQALGVGAARPGLAAYNMGAIFDLTPTFQAVPLRALMLRHGLSVQPHVVPDFLTSTLRSDPGGAILRWYCDQLAPLEKREAQRRGGSIYTELLAEMPEEPTGLMALLGDGPTDSEPSSVTVTGITLSTSRGAVVKALLEGIGYRFAEGRRAYEQMGIRIEALRAAGGGARSDRWLQLTADLLDLPVERMPPIEPAPLGAAILAGIGSGAYAGLDEAVRAAVHVAQRFEPDARRAAHYAERLEAYRRLRDALSGRCQP